MAFSMASISILNVTGSTSTKTGVNPKSAMTSTVAAKVKSAVITSSRAEALTPSWPLEVRRYRWHREWHASRPNRPPALLKSMHFRTINVCCGIYDFENRLVYNFLDVLVLTLEVNHLNFFMMDVEIPQNYKNWKRRTMQFLKETYFTGPLWCRSFTTYWPIPLRPYYGPVNFFSKKCVFCGGAKKKCFATIPGSPKTGGYHYMVPLCFLREFEQGFPSCKPKKSQTWIQIGSHFFRLQFEIKRIPHWQMP